MKITDVVAYSVKLPQGYLFTQPRTGVSDYFLRPGFDTVYSLRNEGLLVRIETDAGLIGWGECLAPVVPEAVATVVVQLLRPIVLGAAIGNFLIMEYQSKLLESINASLATPIAVEASHIAVPNGPGLGVTLNEAALAPYWTVHAS
ncbi:MAG: hypothetical protein HY331_07500 [Chloroflexi bacterium]|nr:hypothetical protein [Chloroflexota bacterium]